VRQAARRAKKSWRVVRRLAINGIRSGGKYGDSEESSERFVEREEDEVELETRSVADGEMLVGSFTGAAIPPGFCQPSRRR
jgi:hypothetical protein